MAPVKPTYRDPIVWYSEKHGYRPSVRGTDNSAAEVLRFLAEEPDLDALLDALLEALPPLTIEDVQAVFEFAGYAVAEPPPVQLTPAAAASAANRP